MNSILAVTITVPALAPASQRYRQWLGYQCIEEGQISSDLADSWDAASMAGNACVILGPPGGEKPYLRLVESTPVPGFSALHHPGWNAIECHVADVHHLARQLQASPFEILGGPRDLLDDGTVVALQVRGYAEEVLYLTQIGGPLRATYGFTTERVGPVFIMVLGTADLSRSLRFYAALGLTTKQSGSMLIKVLAKAHGLDPETHRFAMGSAVGQQLRLEIDQYPAGAAPRPRLDKQLPPGISMISVGTDSLDSVLTHGRGPASQGAPEPPYFGARSAVIVGPDNEWIECIEH